MANDLTQMWGLTFAEARYEHADARHEAAGLIRRLRHRWGKSFPYVYVCESHKVQEYNEASHGWHVHLLLGRGVPQDDVVRAWGKGRAERTPYKAGRGVTAAKAAAGYITKEFKLRDTDYELRGVDQPARLYETGRGYQDEAVRLRFSDPSDIPKYIEAETGERSRFYNMDNTSGYDGPWLLCRETGRLRDRAA